MSYKPLEDYVNLGWSYRLEWWDDAGGYYVVNIDELPGCLSDGKTPEEALNNIREALRCHLQGMIADGVEIPEPLKTSEFKGQFSVRITPEKHCRLARLSGSGATCFGLYESESAAQDAAKALQTAHSGWWVAAAPMLTGRA